MTTRTVQFSGGFRYNISSCVMKCFLSRPPSFNSLESGFRAFLAVSTNWYNSSCTTPIARKLTIVSVNQMYEPLLKDNFNEKHSPETFQIDVLLTLKYCNRSTFAYNNRKGRNLRRVLLHFYKFKSSTRHLVD